MDAHGISKSLNLFLARSRSYGQTATKQTIPDSEDTFDSGGDVFFSSCSPFSWNDTGFWNESIVCSLLRLHLVIVQTFPIFRIFFGCDRHAVTVYIHTTFYESVRQFSIKIIHFNHSCGKWDKLDIASSSVNLNSFFIAEINVIIINGIFKKLKLKMHWNFSLACYLKGSKISVPWICHHMTNLYQINCIS